MCSSSQWWKILFVIDRPSDTRSPKMTKVDYPMVVVVVVKYQVG